MLPSFLSYTIMGVRFCAWLNVPIFLKSYIAEVTFFSALILIEGSFWKAVSRTGGGDSGGEGGEVAVVGLRRRTTGNRWISLESVERWRVDRDE
ncbi:hypothetical protein L2E82_14881 [Cichorium intybus]|uniref:Uncharacterized protein n=1 Tax=Cichorium intybus TaxID=13427 RepID=A0ACB9F0W0_CICIN|nr:hypothetical protein L2E82_14881 [Cichorium intybus]